MVALTVVGVTTTDQSYMPVTITINGIYQDEPVNALGSGNTAPDGYVVGSTAYVRAERAGPGTGRIYFITFTATDTGGNECTTPAPLQAVVPHDQAQPLPLVDTGQHWDSTMIPP
jgi:hypothetical protein